MADWTISSGDYMRPYRTQGSDAGSIDFGYESSVAQSYPVGALLEFDSTFNTLRAASTTGSTVNSVRVIGVAAEPASSIANNTRIYWAIQPHQEFMARTRGGVLGSTTVGVKCGIFRDSSKGVYLLDFGNKVSTSVLAVVTGLIDAAGDSGGYVRFKFGADIQTVDSAATPVGFAPQAQPLRF
jgi:hypothetical protein